MYLEIDGPTGAAVPDHSPSTVCRAAPDSFEILSDFSPMSAPDSFARPPPSPRFYHLTRKRGGEKLWAGRAAIGNLPDRNPLLLASRLASAAGTSSSTGYLPASLLLFHAISTLRLRLDPSWHDESYRHVARCRPACPPRLGEASPHATAIRSLKPVFLDRRLCTSPFTLRAPGTYALRTRHDIRGTRPRACSRQLPACPEGSGLPRSFTMRHAPLPTISTQGTRCLTPFPNRTTELPGALVVPESETPILWSQRAATGSPRPRPRVATCARHGRRPRRASSASRW